MKKCFWYVKVCIFWMKKYVYFWYVKLCIFIQCTIYTEIKKNTFEKINVTKNALFSLSQAPTHHSFSFNSRFLCELKQKFHLSKILCVWDFPLLIPASVLLKSMFLFNRKHGLWNIIISFKIEIIEKSNMLLLPDLWFLSCNKRF